MAEHGKNYKRQVSKLADDYREQIIAHATQKNASWLAAACVLYATGCRPSELQNGVKVSFDFDTDEFIFEILGAKVNETMKRGIGLRIIRRHITNDFVMMALMEKIATKEDVSINSTKAFGNQITRASKEIFPRRKHQASPYSFRHSLACELKNSTLSQVEIAGVMGHRSTASQLAYGRKNKRSAGGLVMSASTSEPIRRKSPLDRFKKKKPQATVSAPKQTMRRGMR